MWLVGTCVCMSLAPSLLHDGMHTHLDTLEVTDRQLCRRQAAMMTCRLPRS